MSSRPETLAGVSTKSCTGQTALVTGSTSGIGRAVALALGRLGADVIVHGRDAGEGEAVVDALTQTGAKAVFVQADFADPDAVRHLADATREWTGGLDLLVNNAGGLFREGRLVGPGVEQTFHVNHLAPFLLTAELVGHLRDGARVVTTASEAHRGAAFDLTGVQSTDDHSGMTAYSLSKLANILFAAELGRRLDEAGRDVVSHSLHPGFVPGSKFGRFLPGPLASLFQLIGVVPGTSSVADGAAEVLHVALSDAAGSETGRYFSGQQPVTPAPDARDREAARLLWRRSADLLSIEAPLE
jgi:hypothetical protein